MPDPTYIVRFGWTLRDVILLPGCVIFVILGALVFADTPLLGAFGILLGAAYIVLKTVAWLSRRVALAVTAEGITLGVPPLSPAAHSAFVPWSDIEAVVLWRQRVWRPGLWRGSVDYIGVVRRADAPPLPGSARKSDAQKDQQGARAGGVVGGSGRRQPADLLAPGQDAAHRCGRPFQSGRDGPRPHLTTIARQPSGPRHRHTPTAFARYGKAKKLRRSSYWNRPPGGARTRTAVGMAAFIRPEHFRRGGRDGQRARVSHHLHRL